MSEFRQSTADGQTFVHTDSGEGPLLILLQGFPDTLQSRDAISAAPLPPLPRRRLAGPTS